MRTIEINNPLIDYNEQIAMAYVSLLQIAQMKESADEIVDFLEQHSDLISAHHYFKWKANNNIFWVNQRIEMDGNKVYPKLLFTVKFR